MIMVMRIYLRRLVSGILPLVMSGMTVGTAAPQDAGAASRGPASLSAGYSHSCVLKGGQAYCWGSNYAGQLGDGGTVQSDVPVAVNTSGVLAGKTLTQIAATEDNHVRAGQFGCGFLLGS